MKKFKGTPGPWEVGDEFRIYGFNGLYIARQSMCLDYEICENNAKLISAAPDLLEALQAVLKVADRATVEFDMARAAINKALGE